VCQNVVTLGIRLTSFMLNAANVECPKHRYSERKETEEKGRLLSQAEKEAEAKAKSKPKE